MHVNALFPFVSMSSRHIWQNLHPVLYIDFERKLLGSLDLEAVNKVNVRSSLEIKHHMSCAELNDWNSSSNCYV